MGRSSERSSRPEPDAEGASGDEASAASAQDDRLKRREMLLAELADARALRARVTPRRSRLARARAALRAAGLRR